MDKPVVAGPNDDGIELMGGHFNLLGSALFVFHMVDYYIAMWNLIERK
jgi:hypothetical protein